MIEIIYAKQYIDNKNNWKIKEFVKIENGNNKNIECYTILNIKCDGRNK